MATAKDYTKELMEGYNKTLKELTKRYSTVVSAIAEGNKNRKSEIDADAREKKNLADAQSKIDLKNARATLLDKGLSKSGETVQAELVSNVSRNRAYSEIDKAATAAKAQSDSDAVKEALLQYTNYVKDYKDTQSAMDKAVREQAEADREFEANREDEYFDRYITGLKLEADRDDEYFDRYESERDYEADREDEYFDRYESERDYEADRQDESFDRELELMREEAKAEEKVEAEEEGISPRYSPKTLVEKLYKVHTNKEYKSKDERYSAMKRELAEILTDETLSYSYRYQVKLYAQAMGIW